MKLTSRAFGLLLAMAIPLSSGGCTPTVWGPHAVAIDSYRAYGEYHPVADDDAIVAKSRSANVADEKIHMFQEALPEGIAMNDGLLSVKAGYHHHLFGKFAYSTGVLQSKDALVQRVKQMCVTVGANAAMIIFQLPSDDQKQAQAIEAVLMDYQDAPPTK